MIRKIESDHRNYKKIGMIIGLSEKLNVIVRIIGKIGTIRLIRIEIIEISSKKETPQKRNLMDSG